nr:glycosyltransferase [uncultured Flavobacterium sp.]
MKTDFSVVIAVYYKDNPQHFVEAIESLLGQTHMPSEIIIVVDGSVNNDLEKILKDYSIINLFKIIRLPKNRGLANALNKGVQEAKYSIVARMDADDICFRDRFEKQIAYMLEGNLDIVGGQIVEFGTDIKDIVSERKVPIKHDDLVVFMKLRSPFSHPAILFKKEVFNLLEGYDINIFPEDYDFFVRAYLKGFKFGNLNDKILWFRLGEDNANAIKRRWGKNYAINEFKLYIKFYKIGFYTFLDFLKAVFLKIPVRLLPFFIYKYIYFNVLRKNS